MKDKIIEAVKYFMDNDKELLQLSAHEQAISHRIAVYLEKVLNSKEFNVDCEYNKHLENTKSFDINILDMELYKACKCESCKNIIRNNINEIPSKNFRPDIVVHLRGKDTENKIVIEVKKEFECPFDLLKLETLTRAKESGGEYRYGLGVFIWFSDNKPKYRWFVDGKEIID
jgi:hypothetical protein